MTAMTPGPPPQLDLRVGLGADGGTAILHRHVAWPWSLPRGFRLRGREGPLTVLPQAAGAALLPGDHWRHRILLQDGHLHLVTAGAGLVHSGGPDGGAAMAHVDWSVEVAQGRLALLPDPWVLSPGARMAQRMRVVLPADACLALMEGVCLRGAPTPATGWDSDTVIRRPSGQVVLRDRQRASGDQLARLAGLPGGMRAFGQVLLLAPAAQLAALDIAMGPWDDSDVWGAVAPLRGDAGVMIRLAATSGGALSAALDAWRARLVAGLQAPLSRGAGADASR